MTTTLISNAERDFIIQAANHNVRTDGREREDIRLAQIDLNVIPQASGSARVRIGGSDVIVAVKAEIGNPLEDKPDWGRLNIAVECSPVASPAFRGRGGDELASELTKALERSMFTGSGSADCRPPIALDTLSIVAGKTCWILYIDGLVLDIDGNVLDVLSIAAKAALSHAGIPKVEVVPSEVEGEEAEYEIDDDPEQASRLDTSSVPLIMTICQVGSRCLLDPTTEEFTTSPAALQVAVDAQGAICGIVKRKGKGLDIAVMMDMLGIVQRKGPLVHSALKSFVDSKLG